MNYVEENAPMFEYVLIDWAKPGKDWTQQDMHLLTVNEAHHKNQAFAMNQTTKRYVKKTNYWELKNVSMKNEKDHDNNA